MIQKNKKSKKKTTTNKQKENTGDTQDSLTVPEVVVPTVLEGPCVLESVGNCSSDIACMDPGSTWRSPKPLPSAAFFRTERTSGIFTL